MTSTTLCPCWLALYCALSLACDPRGSAPGSSSSSSAAPPPPPLESITAAASLAAPSASAATIDPALSQSGIRWGLSCTPAKLTMATRNQLKVTMSATNESKATVDAKLRYVSFSTDGGGSPGRFFGNGHHEKAWYALPPGETVTESNMMGESMLKKPGDLYIAIANDGAKATCSVHVDP